MIRQGVATEPRGHRGTRPPERTRTRRPARLPRAPRRSSGFGLLALLALSSCQSAPPGSGQDPFALGQDAARHGDHRRAVQQFGFAIDAAGEYLYAPARLERGASWLALARAQASPAEAAPYLASAIEDFRRVAVTAGASGIERLRAVEGMGQVHLEREERETAAACFRTVLSTPETSQTRPFHLEAHLQLGWIELEKARGELERLERTPDSPERLQRAHELLREPQEHFSRGLEISAHNARCNLGKGICLLLRGQAAVAIAYLERSLEGRGGSSLPDARGWYYLARAVEGALGPQLRSLDGYRKALDGFARDGNRRFLPLYSHLVEVLPQYAPQDDPRFTELARRLLEYEGEEPEYWSRIDTFSDGLTRSSRPLLRELGFRGRALALARAGRIDEAVENLLILQSRRDFPDIVDEVFPWHTPPRPAYVYGRASTLFSAQRYRELEELFRSSPELRDREQRAGEDPFYRRALVFFGRSIVARWSESHEGEEALESRAKLDREKVLGEARDIFQLCLRVEDEADVRLSLGEVFERLESFSAAFTSYEVLAGRDPTSTEAFRRIRQLHEKKLLPEKDLARAWRVLDTYAGTDPELLSYVSATREEIRRSLELYCRGCGRRASEEDVYCLECGRRLPGDRTGR